eukprot:symbB.v1.2.005227.t1/scaffold293.1/size237565/8
MYPFPGGYPSNNPHGAFLLKATPFLSTKARQHIASIGRSKAWRSALETFDALPGALSQNTSVFNSLASACTKGFAWIRALDLLQAERKGGVLTAKTIAF